MRVQNSCNPKNLTFKSTFTIDRSLEILAGLDTDKNSYSKITKPYWDMVNDIKNDGFSNSYRLNGEVPSPFLLKVFKNEAEWFSVYRNSYNDYNYIIQDAIQELHTRIFGKGVSLLKRGFNLLKFKS